MAFTWKWRPEARAVGTVFAVADIARDVRSERQQGQSARGPAGLAVSSVLLVALLSDYAKGKGRF